VQPLQVFDGTYSGGAGRTRDSRKSGEFYRGGNGSHGQPDTMRFESAFKQRLTRIGRPFYFTPINEIPTAILMLSGVPDSTVLYATSPEVVFQLQMQDGSRQTGNTFISV